MKRFSLLVLLVVGFMLVGCQSTSYRWVKSDLGLPYDCKKTYSRKNMEIQYCLASDTANGEYYFEGIAKSKGAHGMGRIAEGGFEIVLVKGDEIVYVGRLFRQGDQLDKAIYLRKTFNYDGEFDYVGFGWNLSYYN